MTAVRFHVVSGILTGRGLSFDVAALKLSSDDAARAIADIADVAYLQGRDSALLSHEDRFDLSCAVDALRALAVVVGPSAAGERHRRAADVIARLLQEQGEGS